MLKIAFPTDDGQTISQHLGQAAYFVVATLGVQDPPQLEQRAKAHHGDHAQHDHQGEGQIGHGMAQAMFSTLADCQVLISGGMGQPAYERAVAQGFEVILTGEKDITRALEAYQAGTLVSDPRRVHAHH
ncbi:MAG TPA: NifB/NifX family molybdenum-iron cluster-binding protein [Anaerolineales bacterium]